MSAWSPTVGGGGGGGVSTRGQISILKIVIFLIIFYFPVIFWYIQYYAASLNDTNKQLYNRVRNVYIIYSPPPCQNRHPESGKSNIPWMDKFFVIFHIFVSAVHKMVDLIDIICLSPSVYMIISQY